jgi:hypothetical protein
MMMVVFRTAPMCQGWAHLERPSHSLRDAAEQLVAPPGQSSVRESAPVHAKLASIQALRAFATVLVAYAHSTDLQVQFSVSRQ